MAQFNKSTQKYLDSNKSLFETVMISNAEGDVISNFLVADGPDKTAFGRIRTANTRLLGEFRNHYGTYGPVEIVSKFENGGSQTINLPNNNSLINVTNEIGSRALRQSRNYHSYIPGTTVLGFISFTFGTPKENLHQSVGMFDDDNGIFLRLNGMNLEFVIRKGGVDSQVISQEDWNVDEFDGNGPSKIILDPTKSHVLVIDYQWLSVGRVRVGFDIDGQIFYAHYFNHANIVTEPYMYQPSLPVRWEIKNVGATSGSSSMMCIAFGVYIEGSDYESGFEQAVSTGTTPITLNNSNQIGIIAIRLKNTINGIPVKAQARIKEWNVLTDNSVRTRVVVLDGSSRISGTPIWNSASPTSWLEYTTNFALTSETPSNTVVLYDGFSTGVLNKATGSSAQIDNRLATIHQNFDSTDSMIIALVAQRMTNSNTNISAGLQWVESK
jgi:hypothetical protein